MIWRERYPRGVGGCRRRRALALLLAASAMLSTIFGLLVLGGAMPAFTRHESALILLLVAVVLALLAFGIFTGQVRFFGADDAAMLADGWEAMPAASIIVRRNGRPLMANAAYHDLLNRFGHGRVVPVEHLFASRPEAAARIYRMQQHLRDGAPVSEVIRLAPVATSAGRAADHARDKAWWFRITVRLFECEGRLCELWQVEDETARHAEQEQLLERLWHSAAELQDLPVGIIIADGDGQVRYLNATLADWAGRAAVLSGEQAEDEGGAGQAMQDFFPAGEAVSGEGRRPRLQDILPEELVRRLSAVHAAPGGVSLVEQTATLRDASGQPRLVRVLHQAQFDAAGRLELTRTVVLPHEEATTASTTSLEQFIASVPIGVARVDGEGRITFVNAALAHTTPDCARLGQPASDLVAAQDRHRFLAALKAVDEGSRDRVQLDVYLQQPESTRAQISIAAAPGGGALVFVIDTTLKQTLMEQIEHGQIMQQIGMMASQLAHDFNNLLTPIMGSADILLQRMRVTDPNYELVNNIKSRSWDAARIVEQLLAFARRQTMQPEVIAINDWLMRETRLLRTMLKSRDVELCTDYGSGIWPIKADPRKLGRVIVNLVRNAEDAMEGGGRITIRTRNMPQHEIDGELAEVLAVGDYVLIEVSDTGPGIPEDIREKIFDPFFTTKPMGKGTGLGLATVYGIVKQSGGYVFCDSALGQGATFRIYLPRHVETEEERRQRQQEAEARQRRKRQDLTGSGVILLAEDEDTVRDFAVQALKMRGYTVLAAASAELALDIMEERLATGAMVDAIVSDVVMPGMDGPTMVGKLREMGVDAPVVFMSGHAEDAFAQNLDKELSFVFLAKPFDLRTIAEAVKEALAGGGARRGGSDADA